jgi:alkanesulfonate monooxygenase SsuD/methylene tetrahydromethanopterin reductase-like flavin-dependent oxidoreductase (luciferase family)
MRFGVTLPPFNDWSDPRTLMAVAVEAEAAGWDGFFLWDHVAWNPSWGTPTIADPWIALAAVATATSRVLIGTMVTPLARRRPQVVARQLVTLDRLSGGRVVLGVGLGADDDYVQFGEPVRHRGARLDESLAVLTGLLGGTPVDFEGVHVRAHAGPFLPTPANGRIPIWVGGWWPNRAPFARAARYDGVVPGKVGSERGEVLTGDDLRDIRALVGRTDAAFDYVASGSTNSPDDVAAVSAWQAAGATWWLESLHSFGPSTEPMRERIRSGPPRR